MGYEIITATQQETYAISVIIPVYNSEDYLVETLTSILDQSLKRFELILVDDGSTDKSDDIIQSYIKDYSNIAYVKQKNAGPGAARNTGIELAKGDFVCFVDSDDLLPKEALEALYTTAITEEADVVTGASISFNSKKTWYIQSHVNNGVYNPGPKSLLTDPGLLYSIGPCNKLFKTELIKEIRFPNGIKVTEDQPFVIEAYLKANQIYSVDRVIYNYRRRETNQKTSLSQSVTTNALSVLRDIMNSVKISDPLWDHYLKESNQRLFVKATYYNRLMQADIWPAIINFLRQSRSTKQKEVLLDQVGQWVTNLDPSLFMVLKAFASYNKYLTLKEACSQKSLTPIRKRIFIDRSRKLKRIGKQMVKNKVISRFFYPAFKRNKLENKLTFISDKLTELKPLFENQLTDTFKKEWTDFEIKLYLHKKKSLNGFLAYLRDLGTSKVIVTDEYTDPFKLYSRRPGITVIARQDLFRLEQRTHQEIRGNE